MVASPIKFITHRIDMSFEDDPDQQRKRERRARLEEIRREAREKAEATEGVYDMDPNELYNNGYVGTFLESMKGRADDVLENILVNRPYPDIDQNTPLYWAVDADNLSNVTALLEKGARVDEANEHGQTPLLLAIAKGVEGERILLKLLEYGAHVHNGFLVSRCPHCEKESHWSDKSKRCYLCSYVPTVQEVLTIQSTSRTKLPLEFAVEGDSVNNVKALLEMGADVNTPDPWGYTPLIHAIRSGKLDMIPTLLEHGADATQGVNLPTCDHCSKAAYWSDRVKKCNKRMLMTRPLDFAQEELRTAVADSPKAERYKQIKALLEAALTQRSSQRGSGRLAHRKARRAYKKYKRKYKQRRAALNPYT